MVELITVLFERMATNEVREYFEANKGINSPNTLKELKIKLAYASGLVNDAEAKQFRNQAVKNWLDELEDVVYDVDHIVDTILTNVKIQNREITSSASNLEVELEGILERMNLLLENSNKLELKKCEKRRRSEARLLTPLVEECDAHYGREVEKESFIELLLCDDLNTPKISLIPIVGPGGIGKTTLAQLVYGDDRIKRHFDLRVWLTMPEEFDAMELIEEIFRSIDIEREDPDECEIELEEFLRGKRFLFVYDSVWEEKRLGVWDQVKSCFESGLRGSKIVITSRNEIVASHIGNVECFRLKRLGYQDCWNLLEKQVFLDSVDCSSDALLDLKRISVEIIKKCQGIPLAVKSIAGVLSSVMSVENWIEVLESEIWESELHSNDFVSAFWLSYSSLPPNLKLCFAYMSQFPKGFEFDDDCREKLILMWMGQGFLLPRYGNRAEDLGEECLNALVSRSFIRWKTNWENEKVIVVEDVFRDLDLFVSGKTIRHFFYREDREEELIKLGNLPDAKCLRTLFASQSPCYASESRLAQTVLSEVFLSRVTRMRVLSLCGSCVNELPDSLDRLKHLRYFDLSHTAIANLPSSICSLYNLETLLLAGCYKLTKLPTITCRLINLRHLDINGTRIDSMPPRMREMKNLQTLSFYELSANDESSSGSVKELGGLRNLRGSFRISRLDNVCSSEDALEGGMKSKSHLDELVLHWGDDASPNVEKAMRVLDALEPHSELKVVEISGFGGSKFSTWVGQSSFTTMTRVRLIRCRKCHFLAPFGELPCLEELDIWGLDEVVSIGDEFSGTNCDPFPSLKRLTIENMSSWEKWSFSKDTTSVFPRLKELKLNHSKKLNAGFPNTTLPSLGFVHISSCPMMTSIFPTNFNTSYSSLGFLKVTHCENLLVGFSGDVFLPILNKLELTSCEKMSRVFAMTSERLCPSLESLELRNCQSLEKFSETTMLPSSLKHLTICHCSRLIQNRFDWSLKRLSSLQRLHLQVGGQRETEAETSFPEEELFPTSLRSLFISDFKTLKALNGRGFQHLTSLECLILFNCDRLERLPEEGLSSSLTTLYIHYCPLLTERCRRGIGEDWPIIQHISNIKVDHQLI